MRNIEAADSSAYQKLNTNELRQSFVIENLFELGQMNLVYTNVDRAIVGGIVPGAEDIELTSSKEMACSYFCERREVGIINLGGNGHVVVDGTTYELGPRECLYIQRGSRGVLFSSLDVSAPAYFYLVSYPAHTDYPTTKATLKDANRLELGSSKDANCRTIYQYIRPGYIKSCQLVMGFTDLHEGSVWNSFPPHTHTRRTEVYCYFDLPPNNGTVMHFLGKSNETRHVALREKQAVISPAWSIHCGAGTGRYAFVWAMGGENQEFTDMDACDLQRLQ